MRKNSEGSNERKLNTPVCQDKEAKQGGEANPIYTNVKQVNCFYPY